MNVTGVIKDGLLIAFSRSIIRDTINPINLFLYDVTFLGVSYYNKGPRGLFSHHIHPSLGFLWISGKRFFLFLILCCIFQPRVTKSVVLLRFCEMVPLETVKRDYVEGIGDSLDLVLISAWHGNGRKDISYLWIPSFKYSPFLVARATIPILKNFKVSVAS
ncbi:hypothetical protein ZIOFF_048583 [Zingiber officinale]|uniref:ATP-dependent DNA ligase family profile domain-containing protein n=1 Tax=Zingiber officinale TaxID=94328 RepID=A0A8J5KMU0_ZINOF|nr:hypothetical protein ZIOFF_048583 [Zingiber officinale]